MKTIYYLFFLFMISEVKNLEACACDFHSATSVDDCRNCYNIGSFCCLMEYTKQNKEEVKKCTSLTQDEYDNINDCVAYRMGLVELAEGSVYGFSIDCSSYFIKVSILTLLLLLF